MSNTNGIIQKVWIFCDTLREDGVGCGDYLEQITYLLFLKNLVAGLESFRQILEELEE